MGLKWFRARLSLTKKSLDAPPHTGFYRSTSQFDIPMSQMQSNGHEGNKKHSMSRSLNDLTKSGDIEIGESSKMSKEFKPHETSNTSSTDLTQEKTKASTSNSQLVNNDPQTSTSKETTDVQSK